MEATMANVNKPKPKRLLTGEDDVPPSAKRQCLDPLMDGDRMSGERGMGDQQVNTSAREGLYPMGGAMPIAPPPTQQTYPHPPIGVDNLDDEFLDGGRDNEEKNSAIPIIINSENGLRKFAEMVANMVAEKIQGSTHAPVTVGVSPSVVSGPKGYDRRAQEIVDTLRNETLEPSKNLVYKYITEQNSTTPEAEIERISKQVFEKLSRRRSNLASFIRNRLVKQLQELVEQNSKNISAEGIIYLNDAHQLNMLPPESRKATTGPELAFVESVVNYAIHSKTSNGKPGESAVFRQIKELVASLEMMHPTAPKIQMIKFLSGAAENDK